MVRIGQFKNLNIYGVLFFNLVKNGLLLLNKYNNDIRFLVKLIINVQENINNY